MQFNMIIFFYIPQSASQEIYLSQQINISMTSAVSLYERQ